MTYNSKIYKCELCEKSCKSNPALDKHKAKTHKLEKDEDFTIAIISKCLEDKEYKPLSNTQDKKIKKRKKSSKEKTHIDNEVINQKRKSICDDIEMKKRNRVKKLSTNEAIIHIQKTKCDKLPKVYVENYIDSDNTTMTYNSKIYKCELCEKSCKSNSALDKHKAKTHKLEKDGDFIKTNISNSSKDKVYTLLSNAPDKEIKKRKKASKEKIEVDNEALNHKQKRICDDMDTKVIYNNKIYNCEYCKKSCKSKSSLDKHKAKAHKLEKGAATISTTDNSKSSEHNEELLLKKSAKMAKKRKQDNKMNISLMIDEVKTTESPKGDELLLNINHQTDTANWIPYYCRFCNQKFKFFSSLSVHESLHTNNNSSLQCNVCSKTFENLAILYRHCSSMHMGYRPYKCNACESTFTRNSLLIIHYRKHTGERPFACNVCSSAFMQKSDLTVHYRKHTGQRPYACNVCDSTFSSSANRTVHMRTHSGHRPYVCNVCGRSFNQSHVMIEHMRVHTGDKPYECSFCEMSFVSSGDLRKHIKRKHNSNH